MKPKVIVIVGPTASGKTALSIELAKKIDGEIVSCDSMQIYKYMNIGSAKPTVQEMQGIKHYMLDFLEPNERFSVADYKRNAEKSIDEILNKGKIPIVVGGTGLYADSLIYNIEYNEIEYDEEFRKEQEKIAMTETGLKMLYEKAMKIDKEACEKISPNDKKRIIRILEIYNSTGKTKTEQEAESRKNEPKYDYKVFAIDIKREILYDRINRRVDIMLEQGLIEEVESILKKCDKFPTAMQAIGYKEVVEYLRKIEVYRQNEENRADSYIKENEKICYKEMKEKIKQETRRYAKRQLTWFRKNKEIIWIDGLADMQNNINIILEEIN